MLERDHDSNHATASWDASIKLVARPSYQTHRSENSHDFEPPAKHNECPESLPDVKPREQHLHACSCAIKGLWNPSVCTAPNSAKHPAVHVVRALVKEPDVLEQSNTAQKKTTTRAKLPLVTGWWGVRSLSSADSVMAEQPHFLASDRRFPCLISNP